MYIIFNDYKGNPGPNNLLYVSLLFESVVWNCYHRVVPFGVLLNIDDVDDYKDYHDDDDTKWDDDVNTYDSAIVNCYKLKHIRYIYKLNTTS